MQTKTIILDTAFNLITIIKNEMVNLGSQFDNLLNKAKHVALLDVREKKNYVLNWKKMKYQNLGIMFSILQLIQLLYRRKVQQHT